MHIDEASSNKTRLVPSLDTRQVEKERMNGCIEAWPFEMMEFNMSVSLFVCFKKQKNNHFSVPLHYVCVYRCDT